MDKVLKRLKKLRSFGDCEIADKLRSLADLYIYSQGIEEDVLVSKGYFTMD